MGGEDRDVVAALHGFGLTMARYQRQARFPAQVEKTLPRAERGRLKELYRMTVPGTALVPESDTHPAVRRHRVVRV